MTPWSLRHACRYTMLIQKSGGNPDSFPCVRLPSSHLCCSLYASTRFVANRRALLGKECCRMLPAIRQPERRFSSNTAGASEPHPPMPMGDSASPTLPLAATRSQSARRNELRALRHLSKFRRVRTSRRRCKFRPKASWYYARRRKLRALRLQRRAPLRPQCRRTPSQQT